MTLNSCAWPKAIIWLLFIATHKSPNQLYSIRQCCFRLFDRWAWSRSRNVLCSMVKAGYRRWLYSSADSLSIVQTSVVTFLFLFDNENSWAEIAKFDVNPNPNLAEIYQTWRQVWATCFAFSEFAHEDRRHNRRRQRIAVHLGHAKEFLLPSYLASFSTPRRSQGWAIN